jgi:hypothetical protein
MRQPLTCTNPDYGSHPQRSGLRRVEEEIMEILELVSVLGIHACTLGCRSF